MGYVQGEFNTNDNFRSVWQFILSAFQSIIRSLKNLTFTFGNLHFSLLDFFLAILIFGIMFTVLFETIKNFAGQSGQAASSRAHKRRGSDKS